MLSESSTATVRATLPAVSAALPEISARFYDKLFAAHPELLRDLFNRGNQADGSQQQALAGAIAAFASALVQRSTEGQQALLSRIGHKHASLGITRDQYQIVHTHLFAAIADVLGDAVTEDVAAAWSEVYWLMADALTAIEDGLYAEAGVASGDVWRDYRVVARYDETDDVTSFLVRPVGDTPVPAARSGQYVSVRVKLPDGAHQIRQYSLLGSEADELRFAVRRIAGEPDGEVSNHLHRQVTAGSALSISFPFGDVTLRDGDGPVLLASAGIGCTPMVGMLGELAEQDSPREVVAVHADRSQRTHPLRGELEQLVAKLPNATAHVWYEAPEGIWPNDRTGFADLTRLGLPADTIAYLCGPLPFLRSAHSQLREQGVPGDRIHYEVFGPDLWLARD